MSMDEHPSFPGVFLSLEKPSEKAHLKITLSDPERRRPDKLYISGQRPEEHRTSDQEKTVEALEKGTERTRHWFRWR